jgi:glyoxylase-like metal-dependent hydrolase (beta-lactamase superfamily II)
MSRQRGRRSRIMKQTLKVGSFELVWLNGGEFKLDGGTMFGAVPRLLWKKKYPPDEENRIPIVARPILIRTGEADILIETGIGNKLTDKQKKIFSVQREWDLIRELNELGLQREDIDYVILTHYDFDHAGGVIMQNDNGELEFTFPNARHILQKTEWEDVLSPNRRSINTFWPINNELARESKRIELINGSVEIVKGVKTVLTGGHNRGHQIVRIESQGEIAYHLGDLLPTHFHFNPLWIMAYDNYPLDVIRLKESYEEMAIKENAWFTFYHDPFLTACKFDEDGNVLKKVS